jgi:23S rRNA G2445 N2-methylase RlmL
MTTKRAADFDLRLAVQDPGFTPRTSDAGALLDLLVAGDEHEAAAERSLLRLGAPAKEAAIARLASDREGKPRLLRLLGRMADEGGAIAAELVAALGDEDPRARRAAAIALGKARPAEASEALTSAVARERDASVKRAMIEALGKVGGAAARAAIATETAKGDPAFARERARASLMIRRDAARAEPSRIEAARAPIDPVRVWLRCRGGLEPVLLSELPGEMGAKIVADPPAGTRVEVSLRGAPNELFSARTMLSFGFPLDRVKVKDDLAEAVVTALTSTRALAILRRFTSGPLRFRLSFRGGGKRRAAIWSIAERINERVPELQNDPTESPWEAVVHEAAYSITVELVPSLPDPRFTYRKGDVPAASHPTIAAALVRVAGVRDDDVVWDPFVGSGTELCERALAGPYARLVGTDLEAAALATARENLEAAGAHDVTLVQGDSSRLTPPGPPPTLIVSNPPLGRRVQRSAALGPTLDRFLAHAARVLAKDGRLVWISPFPERTREIAASHGLALTRVLTVDMGGFPAELQAFHRSR